MGNIPPIQRPPIQQPPIVRQYPAVNVQHQQMYLEGLRYRRNSTHGYNQNMNVAPPPPNRRGSVIVERAPNTPQNINFYNSSTQNSVSALQEAANIQNNSHLFVPNNWVYRATPNQVIAAPPMQENMHQHQSNGTQNNPSIQLNQNGFRIRTVREINNVNDQTTLSDITIQPQGLPIYNASQPRNHHLQMQLNQRQSNHQNTPPSPPSTPSLEELDVTIKRYGDQIQIFTCPKTGNRENLTDILEHHGDSKKLVERYILDEVFVNGVKQFVLDQRKEGRTTEQLKNQILLFFAPSLPREYSFLIEN